MCWNSFELNVSCKGLSVSAGLKEFGRLAHDGLLLEGKVEEYEKAFSGVDVEGKGVISKDWGVGRGGLARWKDARFAANTEC